MITLKKLVLALDKMLVDRSKVDLESLRSLTDDALAYLKKSKSFEYVGDIKLPGVAFKFVDLNMDLDDIVKELVDKRTDIEFRGELTLIIEEVKRDEKKKST
jgi:hypothetical protein